MLKNLVMTFVRRVGPQKSYPSTKLPGSKYTVADISPRRRCHLGVSPSSVDFEDRTYRSHSACPLVFHYTTVNRVGRCQQICCQQREARLRHSVVEARWFASSCRTDQILLVQSLPVGAVREVEQGRAKSAIIHLVDPNLPEGRSIPPIACHNVRYIVIPASIRIFPHDAD
jgi:hypothetical protein